MASNETDPAPPAVSASASRSTIAPNSNTGSEKHGLSSKHATEGEGESALPEDKREEALERADEDWAQDERNPRNWSWGKKWTMTAIVSFYTFISPVSSSMMAPALPDVASHYGITSSTISAMTLSIFLLAYALGPLLLGPLSEIYGRTWVYHISNIFFFAFNLSCGFAPTVATLIVFRFFAGLGGSASVTIGGGSIGDMFSERERATAMAVYTLGPLLGPSVGPVAGGFIAETIGFRWIFFIIAILSVVAGAIGIPFLKETYAPIIRLRIARAESDNEKISYEHAAILDQRRDAKEVLWTNLTRPFALLFKSFICFILSLYMGLIYGYYYLLFATFPDLFSGIYGFNSGISGLAYLGPGAGFVLSTFYGVYVADGLYKRLADKNGGVGKPEMRIPALILASALVPIGLFWYGWSAQAKLHFMMPIIGAAIFGFGMMAVYLPITLYLVDAFRYAASAIAAATVIRSVFGFVFPLFGEQMLQALGFGGANSLLAGLAVVVGIPFPIWIYYYGERIRERSNLNR